MERLYDRILCIVRKVPQGKVATYGQIAVMAGIQNARMVGYALATIKDGSNVPWFRVINSQGKISFPEESDGFKIQHSLLLKEGIIFDVKNRINLKQFGWNEANE